jgi:hypothetical protein
MALTLTGVISDAIVLEAGISTFSDSSGTTAVTDGQGVGAWKSGSAINAVQATAGRRPVYRASGGPNNLPYMSFSQPSNTNLADTAFGLNLSQCAVFAVTRYRVATNVLSSLFQMGTLTFYVSTAGVWTTNPAGASNLAARDYWCVQGLSLDASASHYADLPDSVSAANPASGAVTGLTLGAQTGGGNGYSGDVAAYVIFNRAVIAADLTALASQLGAYYAVPEAPGAGVYQLVVAGNSFGADYAFAGVTLCWQRQAAGLMSHAAKVYSLGTAAGTTTGSTPSLTAHLSVIEGLPARCGAAVGKRILLIGEGSNETDAAGAHASFDAFVSLVAGIKAGGYYDKIVVFPGLARQNTATTARTQQWSDNCKNKVSPPWDGFIDWMANAHLGPDGAYNDATYFAGDLTHPIAAGHLLMAQIAQPVIDGVISSIPVAGSPGSKVSLSRLRLGL